MESTSQETKASSQPNQGTSLSALIDAIALQEQCFEQSLASQQLWSQQLADAQEAKIKAAVQKTTVCAAEVNEILKGENSVSSQVKTEEFNSERGSKEWEPQLQPPSQQFSRSKSRSTSLFRYPEVHKEYRRYSPGNHVSKRDLGNFNSFTCNDHYKDRQRSSHRENICPSGDRRLHSYRRSPSIERSWKRERRSPSKSKPLRYFHEDFHSPRSGSFRCQSGDSRGRNYRRVCRSTADDNIPHHRRSIDSRKHRERRGASLLEIGRSHKGRDFLAEDCNNKDHRDCSDKKFGEPTGTRSRCQSKQTMHGNSQNYATSGTLNAKVPCSASVCVSNLQDHLPSAFPLHLDMAHSTKINCCQTEKVGNGPKRMTKSEHVLHKETNARTKFRKTREIVNKKELDEASRVNEAFDCRDAKQLLNDPTELTCYPLPEWRSKQQLERQGRKHYSRYEGEESEKCEDAKLEAKKKIKRYDGEESEKIVAVRIC
ncbi:hypothetical protein CRYUN_Cryun13aG0140100 [Craigia yunnanensis]